MYCTCTIFYEACFRHYQLNLPLIPFKLDCSKYVLFSERGWQNIHEKTREYPKTKGACPVGVVFEGEVEAGAARYGRAVFSLTASRPLRCDTTVTQAQDCLQREEQEERQLNEGDGVRHDAHLLRYGLLVPHPPCQYQMHATSLPLIRI